MDHTKRRVIKKIIILGGLFVVILFSTNWLRSHSFLEISAINTANDGSFTYTIINQNTGETKTVQSPDNHIKQLVSKANYLVTVSQNETSYVAFAKTRGFLSSAKVANTLQPEKERTFVGNEPDGCFYYTQILYSYDCNEEYSSLKIHLPGDQNQPTYTENNEAVSSALIRGHAVVGGQPLMLIKYIDGALIDDSTHALYPFRTDLKLINPILLKGLDNNESYSMVSYKEGFLVYSPSFEDIKYYSSPSSTPETIQIEKPSEDMQLPINVSASGSSVATLFNPAADQQEGINDTKVEPNKPIKGKSEFLVYNGSQSQRFQFKTRYTSGGLCGEQRACLISNGRLDFYDLSKQKPELLFSLPDVQATQAEGKTLLIAMTKNILALDTSTLTGSVQYSYGDYEYCGMQTSAGGYTLCVKNKQGKSSALYINPAQDNTGSIDKKVLTLLDQSYISGVSAYKSYIYISPELGEPEYSSAINGYVPNPETKQRVATDIQNIVNQLGINRSVYTVINTRP